MEKEKRKRSARRITKRHLYIIIGLLILFSACSLGFQLGYEANNDGLQSLTKTQIVRETQNPINILNITQQVIETESSELQITRTAIANIQLTIEPNQQSND